MNINFEETPQLIDWSLHLDRMKKILAPYSEWYFRTNDNEVWSNLLYDLKEILIKKYPGAWEKAQETMPYEPTGSCNFQRSFDWSLHFDEMKRIIYYYGEPNINENECWNSFLELLEDYLQDRSEAAWDEQQEDLMSNGSSSSNRYPTTLSEYIDIKECRA